MRRWVPWAAAFVVWNMTFDYQVRVAGDRFVAEQLARSRRGDAVALIRDAFRPQVRQAAVFASGAALLVCSGGVLGLRRRAPAAGGRRLDSNRS